jgi:hypothetical protein
MGEYLITWMVEIQAETPLEAVRTALAMQRDPYSTANLFGVGYFENNRWHDEEIDLGEDNPFGRPLALIGGGEVRCGHCGSSATRYLESIGRYCPIEVDDRAAYARKAAFEFDADAADPCVWCLSCSRESLLPTPFELRD